MKGRPERDVDAERLVPVVVQRLFVEQGYDAVTAGAIAAAAGVSTGTFYTYFGDKRDALLLLLAERIDDVLGVGDAGLRPALRRVNDCGAGAVGAARRWALAGLITGGLAIALMTRALYARS